MNIRPSGLAWLQSKGRATDERVRVSKYYTADEAWPGKPVWWFEFPESYAINERFMNLLCQVAPNSSDFHHLRVPMRYFLEHKHHLGFRGDKFSLYFSTERLFMEIRGDGQVEFRTFKVA